VDLWFCNSTVNVWDSDWSCQEVDTDNSYRGIMEVSEEGNSIYLLYTNSTNMSSSYIFLANSSDSGKTWTKRTSIGPGGNLAKFNSIFPITNITDRLPFLYEEVDFDVHYGYILRYYDVNQLLYMGDGSWQINVTVPVFESGLKDLYINASYSGLVLNDTETEAIDYGGGAADSCTYTSGNWVIYFEDYCNITSNVAASAGTNNLTINGTGIFTTTANISGFKNIGFYGTPGQTSYVRCLNGGCFT
jgi:hypothetical protein